MNLRKFFKNFSILSLFALMLLVMGYGTYVYADKYVWTSIPSPTSDWQTVAIASNGMAYAGRLGQLYVSSNGGTSWTLRNDFGSQYSFTSIATSEDGGYVLATVDNVDDTSMLLVSNDYGTTFSQPPPYYAELGGVAMSDYGQHMYVTAPSHAQFFYSNDFGSNWNSYNIGYQPVSVATSNSGQYVYVTTLSGYVFRSDDFGTNLNPVGTTDSFKDVSTSATGASVYVVPVNGMIKYSTDYGVTFNDLTSAGSRTWKAISVSGDGSRIAAIAMNGSVYTSRDSGATFTTESAIGAPNWNDVSLSSDGYTALLASSDGYVWVGTQDVTAPAISTITPNAGNATYKAGQSVIFVVSFSEPLYNSSSVTLTFETGAVDRFCEAAVTNGDTAAVCTYVVQTGDLSTDLGTNSITGIIYDDNGNPRTSHVAAYTLLASNSTVVIDGTIPTVSFTNPTTGSTASSTITLTATTTDTGTGIAGVQFKVGTTNIGSEDTSSPYSVSWDTTGVSDGTHSVLAVARDGAGNYATSTISVTVDNTAPAISFTAPSADATVNGTATLTASTTDVTSSVAGVQFLIGTTNIGVEDTSSPYTVSWDTTAVSDGAGTLYAVVRDTVGNIATTTISVTVTNTVAGGSTSNAVGGYSGGGYQVSTTQNVRSTETVSDGSIIPNSLNGGSELPKTAAAQVLQAAGISDGFRFTKNTTLETVHNEVSNIQKMLNIMGYTVAPTGAGSKGNETSYFGQLTRAALLRFQKAFRLPVTGYFGPLSRAIMNSILKSIQQ